MGGVPEPLRNWRAGFAAIALLCGPFNLTACAANSYFGIPLNAGAAEPELQALARRAQAGDKYAQLELGIRFEEGRGLPADLRHAERLYLMAAGESGGRLYIYSPAVGARGRPRVTPVDSGIRHAGLDEARIRFTRLHERASAAEDSNAAPPLATAGVAREIEQVHESREIWAAIRERFETVASRSAAEAHLELSGWLNANNPSTRPEAAQRRIHTSEGEIDVRLRLLPCQSSERPYWASRLCTSDAFLRVEIVFHQDTRTACFTNHALAESLSANEWRIYGDVQPSIVTENNRIDIIQDAGLRLEDIFTREFRNFVVVRPSVTLPAGCKFDVTMYLFSE